ncbi:MAG TPA: nitroreductase family protein [Desulfomonilaceae bacterium]|nr:nitroreductase family protein [Desulfomonilaceae bacterium]
MDLFDVIKGRRSCRKYLPDPVGEDLVEKIIEAAMWAPSPANNQPWEFVAVTNRDVIGKIFEEADYRKKILYEKSGWKWINRYDVGFLKDVPLIIAVLGDPKKSGADLFLTHGAEAYQHACSAAIQNMLLTAHAVGLGGLWFTLFEKDSIRQILNIATDLDPVALVCIGKPGGDPFPTPRKEMKEKIRYIS